VTDGDSTDLHHLIPCSNSTLSGIQVRRLVKNHLIIKELANCFEGPAISNKEGKIYSTKLVDDTVHELLIDIFQISSNLFPPSIDSPEKNSLSTNVSGPFADHRLPEPPKWEFQHQT